jgi:hypothetical protein
MSIVLTSTTSTPEEVQAALDAYGDTESVESISPETGLPEAAPEPETPPEPEVEPVVAAQPEPEAHAEDDLGLSEAERKALSAGAWKQYNKITRQRYEEKEKRAVAEARAADLEKRLADMEARANAKPPEPEVKAPPVVEAPKPEPKPKPKAEDFEQGVYDPLYLDALMDWRDEQRAAKEAERLAPLQREVEELRAQQAKQPAKTQAEVQAELDRQDRAAQFVAQVEEARKEYPDYDTVANNTEVMVSGPFADAISDDPDTRARLFYYLGKNPEDAKRVFEATQLETDAKGNITTPPHVIAQRIRIAAREHSRIVGLIQKPTVAADAAPPPKAEPKPKSQVTKAPPPIKPGSSVSAPATGTNPYELRANDPMSVARYNAWRDQQQRRN